MNVENWIAHDKYRGTLQEVSVVKKTGVPRAERKIDNCRPPDANETTRYVGIQRPPPANLEYRDYEEAGLFQDSEDMVAIEAIIDERDGKDGREYKVRWQGFDASHDSWLKEAQFSFGFQTLLREWKDTNKRKQQQQQIQQNAKKAQQKYKPDTKNIKDGDVVILKAPKTANTAFYVAKVLHIHRNGIARVHWYGAKSIHNTWSLQYRYKQGKGTAGAYVQRLNVKNSILDKAPELKGIKSGKLGKKHIDQILELLK